MTSPAPISHSPTEELEEMEAPTTVTKGYYYFGTGTDIDDQKKAEVSLIDARKAAERMAEMKSQWVANMSHELRTPSNGILGMLDLLMDTPLNAEQKDYVATMRRSTNVLLTVISDILDFRRNETRQVKLQVEPFSIQSVMEDVCEILFPLAAQKNVELVHVVAPDVPRLLLGDAARLRQVLVNLINNSIKFSNDNGGHVEVTCHLTTQDPNELVSVPSFSENTASSSSISPLSSPESSPCPSPTNSPSFSHKFAAIRLQTEQQTAPPPGLTMRRPSAVFSAPLGTNPPTMLSATLHPASPTLSLKLPAPAATPPPTSPPSIATPPPTSPALQPVALTTPLGANVWLKFQVSDSGVGIPKEQQSMLFEPFFQVDSSATRKHGGTGLGLAISRQIVAALGGRIWVQSEEGSGSTFSFTSQFSLPAPVAALPPTSPSLRSISTNPPSPQLRGITSPPSRFVSPPPLSSTPEPIPPSTVLPQQVIAFSDRKGAVMRVAQGYLAQIIPSIPPHSSLTVVNTAAELPFRLGEILANPLPPVPPLSTPYVACVLEISDVPSINAALASLAPFFSRKDCICRVVIITIPHLRAQITLPTATNILHQPPVVCLMKPLSESKLRTSLAIVTSPSVFPLSSPKSPKAQPFLAPTPIKQPATSPILSSISAQNVSSPAPVTFARRPSYQAPSSIPQPYIPRPSTPPPITRASPRIAKSYSNDYLAPTQPSASSPRTPPPLRLSASTNDAIDRRDQQIRRALCVEDNLVNQKVIIFHLKKLGFVVDIANDGAEAVDMVGAHPIGYYEFILMDLQMPVMDGFVATRLIREREAAQNNSPTIVSPLPIIAITANVMPGVQQRCNEAGMDGYVSKPVQALQLLQVLKELAIIV